MLYLQEEKKLWRRKVADLQKW